MKNYLLKYLLIMLLAIINVLGCSEANNPAPPFDGERAYQYLIQQVNFGPRVPGSEASSVCRDYYYDFFTRVNLQIDSQNFTFFDPYSNKDIPCVNVIASYKSSTSNQPGIILMAHYDSRPRTDFAHDKALLNEPIDGANDGASGIAVLMELANVFVNNPPAVDVDLVLVDAEDWGKSGDNNMYLLGSKEFARRGIRGKYQFGIVIDMIGDKDQQIYREGYSQIYHKDLNDLIWETANKLGINTFIDTVKNSIIDDHLSVNTGGVPCVNIIDFDYPYWHTEFDTPDKCSAQSLENVGKVLLNIIYNPSKWPKK